MTDVSMQRILLDTNVLLDYLLHRDDHAKMAEAVMELGAKNNITLLCASLSLKDIAYLSSSAIRREFKPNESEVENFTRGFLSSRVPWRCIEQVKEMCDIVAVDESTCDKAFSLQKRHRDFEDDLIIVAAQQSGANCVVTSDAELISHFPEYCKTPARRIDAFLIVAIVAALLAEAVGPQLTCVFVDHGLMRLNEGDEVEAAFKKWDINFVRVNAEGRFLSKLAGISDPERKRKIIGEEFIRVFEEESKKIGAVDFLAQGTIYPDVIESGLGNAAVIKSHHNVGGLPDYVDFKEIIEPLRLLFKDEVRQLGRELGLPEYLVSRQPFPGPGLAIRIMGEITKEKADTLRLADAIYREELEKAGENKKMNQYFAVLTDTRTVGVMGDGRSYDRVLALRAVTTEDFMTADWARIPYELLDKISGRIVNEVKGINRIVYDITSKPPATVEWE